MTKRYTIFAGINGAGKSTFYHTFYEPLIGEKRINTDEMVARIGSWKDGRLQLRCAREAVRLMKQYFEDGISFNQETTLTGQAIVRNVETAKAKEYEIHLSCMTTATPCAWSQNSTRGIWSINQRISRIGLSKTKH